METGTAGTATRARRMVPVAAALMLAVGLLSSGCRTTAAVEPAIVVDDGTVVVGVANIPGGRMLPI